MQQWPLVALSMSTSWEQLRCRLASLSRTKRRVRALGCPKRRLGKASLRPCTVDAHMASQCSSFRPCGLIVWPLWDWCLQVSHQRSFLRCLVFVSRSILRCLLDVLSIHRWAAFLSVNLNQKSKNKWKRRASQSLSTTKVFEQIQQSTIRSKNENDYFKHTKKRTQALKSCKISVFIEK